MAFKLKSNLVGFETGLKWLEKHVRSRVGQVNNKCEVVLENGVEPPRGQAYCFRCGVETHWRGPVPGRGDAPLVTDDKGYTHFCAIKAGEHRADAARRLYAIVNKYDKKPMPHAIDGLSLWQGALCWKCEVDHMNMWMDRFYPPAGSKRRRQGGTEID